MADKLAEMKHSMNGVVVARQRDNGVAAADLLRLAEELARLRQAMRQEARKIDHIIATSQIAQAEQAAQDKDQVRVLAHLKLAGSWPFEVALKIGLSLAVEAIRQAMQLTPRNETILTLRWPGRPELG